MPMKQGVSRSQQEAADRRREAGGHGERSDRTAQGERSHRTDPEEFYPLLDYGDDVDLNKKLAEWERFYNLTRPHGAFGGHTRIAPAV